MIPLSRHRCISSLAFGLWCFLAISPAEFGISSARADEAPPALTILVQALAKSDDPSAQLNLLRGINAAMKGRRDVAAPAEWADLAKKLAASNNAEVREQAQTLGAVFGSSGAFDAMRKVAADPAAEPAAREKAIGSLVAGKDPQALPLFLELVKQPGPLRRTAVRALATYGDDQVPAALLTAYPTLDSEEKRDALATLLTRLTWARMLIVGENSKVPVTDLTASHVRQLKGFNDAQINEWLKRNPTLMATSADKQAEIARYKTFLTPAAVKAGDVNRGRAFFAQTCAACHVLFGTGGTIGPELTGANRADLDYLLQNILDPNAFIGVDYQSTTVETKDGRILVGVVRADDGNSVTLKTLAESVVVPRGDIQNLTLSEVSMMPEGLLTALKPEEVRDLFAYMAAPQQVPMLATPLNAGDFFNGSDLSRWRASDDTWRVESGVMLGRAAASGTASLMSEMVADDFRFTAQLKLTGEKAAAEFAFRGSPAEAPFTGISLSFGGAAPVNLWKYGGGKPTSIPGQTTVPLGEWFTCEVSVRGTKLRVLLNGTPAFELEDPVVHRRGGFGLYVSGAGAELSMKEAKLEIPPAPTQ